MTNAAEPPPTATAPVIPRPRLTGRLAAEIRRRHVVLAAGAGYGKSTAVQAACDEVGWSSAWVTAGDTGGAAQLLRELVASIGAAVPGLAARGRHELLDRPPVVVLGDLVAELDELLVTPLVIVVDDAEHVAESDAEALVAELLRASSTRLRVVVATRRPLDLRVTRAEAAGRVVVLGREDLAFDDVEARALLAARGVPAPTDDELAELMARTAGWPFAVVLYAATGAKAADGRDASDPGAALQLFTRRVLERSAAGERGRLLRSALPVALTPAVRDALGLGDALLRPFREESFLAARPAEPAVERWHPLVREFLLAAMADEAPEVDVRATHHAIAAALVGEGRSGEAVTHFLAADAPELALDAMAACVDFTRLSPALVASWLQRLPSHVAELPRALLIAGQLQFAAGDVEAAIESFSTALPAFAAVEDHGNLWGARLMLMPGLLAVGRWAELPGLAEGFDAPEARTVGLAPPLLAVSAAEALASLGRHDEADDVVARARRHPDAAELAVAFQRLAGVHDYDAGRVEAAVLILGACDGEAGARSWPALLKHLTLLGVLVDSALDDDRAQREGRRAVRDGEASGLVPFAQHARVQLAALACQQGRIEDAERLLARVDPTGHRGPWPGMAPAVAARVAAAAGDGPRARALAAVAEAQIALTVPHGRAMASRWVVTALAELGDIDRARGVLDASIAAWDGAFPGDRGRLVRARHHALSALLLDRGGEPARADAELVRTLAVAGDAAAHVLRPLWRDLWSAVWAALGRDGLDPFALVTAAVGAGLADGDGLEALTRHPRAATRHAAAATLLRARDPTTLRRVPELATAPDPAVADAAHRALAAVRERPPALTFTLLGGFSLRRDGWRTPAAAWERPTASRLVRVLVLRHDRWTAEDELVDLLWPGRPADRALRALRVALSQARGVLDAPGAPESRIAVRERSMRLVLGPSDAIDAEAFEALADDALASGGDVRRVLLERALTHWGGEPLPEDRDAGWARAWRERLRLRHIAVLVALTRARLDGGDAAGAAEVAEQLVALDPLNEQAHRDLMLAYATAGRVDDALRQFLVCRRALDDGLGLGPDPETRRLHAAILSGQLR